LEFNDNLFVILNEGAAEISSDLKLILKVLESMQQNICSPAT